MILAVDLGATNCRFAVFNTDFSIVEQQRYLCKDYNSFEEIVHLFLEQYPFSIKNACFGIPGPVIQGACKITGSPWKNIHEKELTQEFGFPVKLLNDVEANAYGLQTLRKEQLFTLNEGVSISEGTKVILAVGTGLGEGALIETKDFTHALATEGGSVDFGPSNELQCELYRYAKQKYPQVNYETLAGGRGLVIIYNFLLENGYGTSPQWLEKEFKEKDQAAVISRSALDESCPLCVQTLDLFISILAAEAGNMALKFLATGGVYIGGGIAPVILEKLRHPSFIKHFTNKYQLEDLLKSIPVHVLLDDKTALYGSAWYALSKM
jgi:glucokinase